MWLPASRPMKCLFGTLAVEAVGSMPDLDLDRHVAELETDGYTVVPDVISDSERAAMRQAMHETLDAEKEIARRFRSQTEDLLHCFNGSEQASFLLRLSPALP